MFDALRVRWQDFRAWRRGEKRVAPRGTRGRVYAPKGEIAGGAAGEHLVEQKTEFIVTARVIRADGRPDEIHDLSGGS